MVARAREIKAALPSHATCLVNDRVDVALAAGCAGVHLGAKDKAAADARRLLGPDAIIGCTVRSAAEAEAVPETIVDYASVGGVFATASKHNPEPPIGLDGLRELIDGLPCLPICAIAGIGHGNAAEVIAAGAGGVAVVSDIFMADDVAAATRRLRDIVDAALDRRRSA